MVNINSIYYVFTQGNTLIYNKITEKFTLNEIKPSKV